MKVEVLLVFAILFFAAACGGSSKEHAYLTDEDLSRCFNDYEGFEKHWAIDRRLKVIVCEFLTETGHVYFHHSDWRKKGQHPYGRALDFHMDDNTGLGMWERRHRFQRNAKELNEWLIEKGYADEMGLGIYPFSRNPFVHLDIRGKKARWGRLPGHGYVAIEVAWQALEDYLAGATQKGFFYEER